jgi:transcriptional regulator with XRE-family HTH domain
VTPYNGDGLSLGALIAWRRQELGRSQIWLADRICAISGRATVTRHEVSRYERETRIPTGTSLRSLAVALGLPITAIRQAAAAARRARRGVRTTFVIDRWHLDNGFGFCRTCRQFSPCNREKLKQKDTIVWVVSRRTR